MTGEKVIFPGACVRETQHSLYICIPAREHAGLCDDRAEQTGATASRHAGYCKRESKEPRAELACAAAVLLTHRESQSSSFFF